jgi:hypothetical protein
MKKLPVLLFASIIITPAVHPMTLVKKLKFKQISAKIPTNFIAPFMSLSPAQSPIKDNDSARQPDRTSFFAPSEQRRRTKKITSHKKSFLVQKNNSGQWKKRYDILAKITARQTTNTVTHLRKKWLAMSAIEKERLIANSALMGAWAVSLSMLWELVQHYPC